MSRWKTTISCLLIIALCFSFCMTAYAVTAGDKRVVIAADITQAEKEQIYKDFGVKQGEVVELTVTNADERAYLHGLVDESKIGSVALSCAFIEIMEPGTGLTVLTNNINYCTPQMYKNALTTAGIQDARVMVSAPHVVSGTAALTGVYKAYESVSGNALPELAKQVGAEELIVTGQLAEYVGSDEATGLINELKTILDQTVNMTDAQVLEQIDILAKQYNVALTEGQRQQLLKLCRSMERLDARELRKKLVDLSETVEKAGEIKNTLDVATEKAGEFVQDAKEFAGKVTKLVNNVAGFFKNLLGE
ncbi:MAG: DUF1002 domain-containing protein [Eubacteriales bacterium]|nr:DUF1002 domain-containing protein [Eubacteriales bacterium]